MVNEEDRMKPESGSCSTNTAEIFMQAEKRIEQKLQDYTTYDFPMHHTRALNIFFDLCQEMLGREQFYAVCLSIPRSIFGIECAMYVLEDEDTFSLAACSPRFPGLPSITETRGDTMRELPVRDGHFWYVPIICNPDYNDMLPFVPRDNIIGNFVYYLASEPEDKFRLFLEKYVNRVGFQLHSRLIRARSREHLDFIRNLVEDIGHNVIVPNIYFKLYFNRLRRHIKELETLSAEMVLEQGKDVWASKMLDIHDKMHDQFGEIYNHYVQTSMFLETLMRRRHFEEGRYVLERKRCNMRRQIIEPQLERYRHRLEERGIFVDMSLGGMPDQIISMDVDLGLISQVYANLFSNALKYTGEATLPNGKHGKFISYGWEVLKDFFGPGNSGIRLFVFTTGEPLRLQHPLEIFDPGFRADNVEKEQGSGHGLYFVRQVIDLHKGKVGFSTRSYGNEIYFVLPFNSASDSDSKADSA